MADLTAAVEAAAARAWFEYGANYAHVEARWNEAPPATKHAWREAVLPIVTATLAAVDHDAVVAERDEAYRELRLRELHHFEAEQMRAEAEAERDALLRLVQAAIQTHRDLHRVYGNTATCGGGIGGQALTQHCGVTCGHTERHAADNDRWDRVVEAAYFRYVDGDPDWTSVLDAERGEGA